MAFRKRRKPRVVWLPVHGTDFLGSLETFNVANGLNGTLTVPGGTNAGALVHEAQAVTFDYSDAASFEEFNQERSLQDLTSGNAYRLRRIVGKFFGAAVSDDASGPEVIPTIDVAAGFMVNRTDDNGNIVTLAGDTSKGPLAQDAASDPWIWRRRWLLTGLQNGYTNGSPFSINTVIGDQGQWPQTTAGYGSVLDGGHIDQKTARVISNQERLFFWVQARCTSGSSSWDCVLNYSLDVRLLATLRMNQGNRRNASR